ncbi:MAG: hypothetical protein ACJ74U_16475 [Jatrophihabitantaceae bacterium]
MGLLIDLEGIDGAGKTTVAQALVESLGPSRVRMVHHKELGSEQSTEARLLRQLIWPAAESSLSLLPSRTRVLLHAAWMVLMSEQVLAPLLAGDEIVVVDGWMHKMLARLVVDGYSEPYLREVFQGVTPPQLVVLLDPGAELVWERATGSGRKFGAVEMGKYAGYPVLGRDSYLDYQSRFVSQLRSSLADARIPVLEIREDLSVAATCEVIERAIGNAARS